MEKVATGKPRRRSLVLAGDDGMAPRLWQQKGAETIRFKARSRGPTFLQQNCDISNLQESRRPLGDRD